MIYSLNKSKFNLIEKIYKDEFGVDFNYNDPFKKVYYYMLDNEIIGFIDYSLIYDRIELNYIFVVKKYRNKGIASLLINKMLEENIDNISLEVNVNNLKAINLYKKYNFEIVATRDKYYNNEDAYLMLRK